MDRMRNSASTAASIVVVASMVMASTSALGACKTTLRGELVQAPAAPVLRQAYPEKFLFFNLVEMTPASRTNSEKSFQSFVVPNMSTTLPIPFALEIDSPQDCPSEVELRVFSDARRSPGYKLGSHEPGLRGGKTISLDKFAIIPVWGPYF
jgi:hypothetical protein